MAERQWLDDDEDEVIQKTARDQVVAAVAFAEESPYPLPEAALRDVLAMSDGGQL